MGLIVKCEIVYRGAERAHSLLRFSLTYAAISFCSLEWDELWAEHILSRYFWQKLWAIFSIHKWTLSLHSSERAPKPLSIFATVVTMVEYLFFRRHHYTIYTLYGGLKNSHIGGAFFHLLFPHTWQRGLNFFKVIRKLTAKRKTVDMQQHVWTCLLANAMHGLKVILGEVLVSFLTYHWFLNKYFTIF